MKQSRGGGGGGGGGGGTPWSAVYRCVNKKKNDEKGYFFRQGSAQRCALFRVGKMLILWEKGMFFSQVR